jgi:hypothetical protein
VAELHELDAKTFRALLLVLERPRLRIFACLAAELGGLEAAVRACHERHLDDKIRERFAGAGWTEADLPPGDVMEAIILHVRLRSIAGRKGDYKAAAAKLGVTFPQVAAATRAYTEWTL